MSLSLRRIPCLTVSALTLLAAASQAGASSATGYLTWQGKANAPQPQAGAQYPTNPVPPSPYGQVGNPFVQTLNWPTKSRADVQAQQQQPVQQPQAEQPRQTLASVSVPVPLTQPAPVAVMQLPPPPPRVTVPAPQPSQQRPIAPEPAAPQPAVRQPAPRPQAQVQAQPPARPVAVQPAPQPAPPPVVAAAPVQAPTDDAGYQVPATSKYAARIASARAAAQPAPQAPVSAPAAPQPAAPTVATAPEPGASMASEETDHVFIPGEHYTDASDEPRYYSLHRQYGIKPDPITVDHDATGALLDTTHFDAQEAKDDDASSDDSDDTSDKSDSSDKSDKSDSSTDDSQPAN